MGSHKWLEKVNINRNFQNEKWEINFLKFSKNWIFQKSNSFSKMEVLNKQFQKWHRHNNLQPDGNLNYIVTWCSYSAKIKFQYMKNTFHVAHFHINMVLSTRNMFKEVQVIKSRGALGTGFTYGNERWTANLVTARITRRARAPLICCSFSFSEFAKKWKCRPKFELFKKNCIR